MKMKAQVVFNIEYDLTDDLDERQRIYESTDPYDCARLDEQNTPSEFMNIMDPYIVSESLHIAPVYSCSRCGETP